MSTLALWLAIAGAGAVTFALRLSFIALLGRIEIPLLLGRALRFVPAAVLTAVVIPLLLYENGALEVSPGNERLLAGLVGALIAWRTRSVLFTLGGGMVTLWTLQAIGQSLLMMDASAGADPDWRNTPTTTGRDGAKPPPGRTTRRSKSPRGWRPKTDSKRGGSYYYYVRSMLGSRKPVD